MTQLVSVENQSRPSASLMIMNPAAMQEIYKFAEMMAAGRVSVPKHFQGNVADCMAVTMQSMQWGLNPFAVAQKTHMTPNGSLGYEAQLISSVVTESGAVDGDPEYIFIGDWNKVLGKVEERKSDKPGGGKYYVATYTKADEQGLGVTCRLKLKGEDKPRDLTVMMSQCYPRFSTQWATDPKMQICYVAIRKWTRLNKPGVILGIYTPDELQEIHEHQEVEINPIQQGNKPATKKSPLKDLAKATTAAVPADDAPEFEAHVLSVEAQKQADRLVDCQSWNDLNEWAADSSAKFPEGHPDFNELVRLYNERGAQLPA